MASATGPAAVRAGALVQLDGSGSTSSDDAALSYRWTFLRLPPGSHASLNDPGVKNPSFTAELAGEYEVQLIVAAGGVESEPASVVVMAGPCGAQAPSAGAISAPASVAAGTYVSLGASPSDPDDDVACTEGEDPPPPATRFSYAWRLVSAPAGSGSVLNDSGLATPSFLADVPGSYGVELTVYDDGGQASLPVSATVEVTECGVTAPAVEEVTSSPAAPLIGQPVVLTFTASDGDNDAGCDLGQTLSASWSIRALPPGSGASLNDPTSAAVSLTPDVPGDYVVGLRVLDDTGLSSSLREHTITVGECGTHDPAIEAIAATGPLGGTPVTYAPVSLTATVSDPDNAAACGLAQTATWHWSIVSLPAGSAAALNQAGAETPSFTPDVPGTYAVALQVVDVTGRSADAELDVVVDACGSAAPSIAAVTLDGGDAFDPVVAAADIGEVLELAVVASDPDDACGAGTDLSYAWRILSAPAGSLARFNDATLAAPSFAPDVGPGEYQLLVEVSDETGAEAASGTVTLTVSGCGASAPVADIDLLAPTAATATPVAVTTGATVQVSPGSTADPDDACRSDPLFYTWELLAAPAGSFASLSTTSGENPWFVADQDGTYVVRLRVSDGAHVSDPVEFTIESQ